MPTHEQKNCPRCNKGFECNAGNISDCQCNDISLTAEEKALIQEKYTDCLCRSCLLELKEKEGRKGLIV